MKKKQKIVLIGPVYPYKGGISHYTGLMYNALLKEYEVVMVSYKFQYPGILYKKEQRDYENDSFKIEDTHFWIHTANPFNWRNTVKKINKIEPTMVIIQWWHPYFAPCYCYMTKYIKKAKIVFICHNVFPHERFPMDRLLTKLTLRKGECFVVQSRADEEDLKKIVPNPVYERTVHPTYNVFKFENMSKMWARQLLHLKDGEKVLLFFGFVREYKGLKYLIKAMPLVRKRLQDVRLLIVGDFGRDKQDYLELIETSQCEKIISIYDGYIPDKEVEKYFAACDLVILPYESATQSGIVQIAYGFEKPVVVTNVGGLPDVVNDGNTGYVVETQNPEKLAEAVIKYYENNMEEKFIAEVKKEAYRFSWDRMVEVINRLKEH